ncbi:MAG: ribosome maturation factor RimM [Myxococcota bacterium]
MTEAAASDFVFRIGAIARAHGLEGHLMVRMFRDRVVDQPGQLLKAPTPQPLELETIQGALHSDRLVNVRWLDGSRVVLRLQAVQDRTAAEGFEGGFVAIDPRHPPALLCDRWDRLYDVPVHLEDDGSCLGRVVDVRSTGAHPMLLIGDEELMIPAVEAFVRIEEGALDPADPSMPSPVTKVWVRPIPGLLEVNRRPPES